MTTLDGNGRIAGSLHSAEIVSSTFTAHRPVSPSHHTVQFYSEDAHLERSVARFVAAALVAGDAAVVAATPEHRAAIARILRDGPDRVADRKRVVYLDAAQLLRRCLRNGRPDPERFDAVIGGVIARALTTAPRVAIYGELVALLGGQGKHDQALELERYWNIQLARFPVSLLCGYPLKQFASKAETEAFRLICEEHHHVIPAEEHGDTNDDQWGRTTAMLQHRSYVLETEAEERERTLRQRHQELLAALAARDQFLMAAAHELKTPITSLRIYSQILQRDLANQKEIAPARLGTVLEAIERQTGQLSQLINRLLDVAQIESDTLRIAIEPSDIATIARRALRQHEHADTHRFVLESPERLPASADPVRLEQVVAILLANAVRFSPKDSTVTMSVGRNPTGAVELSVSDEGDGVEPGLRDAIFQRFQHVDGQYPLPGLGLSLPIARRIVELHGGTIRVESAASGGARFVVTLPAVAPQA